MNTVAEIVAELRGIGSVDDHSHIADVANRAAVELLNVETDAKYWRERCRRYEAHTVRIDQAASDIRGAVERFGIVLEHIKPKGTEPKA